MQKKIATPTSRRIAKCPLSEPGASAPAKNAACVPRTAMAAIARRASIAGSDRRRSASPSILSAVGRPTRAFTLRLAGLAAAGVALRALYLFTVGRHVTGIGDWHFYHWQANLIADGHGFIEPYKWLFEHRASPSAGHPPLYPLALAAVSELGGDQRAVAPRAGRCTLGAVTIVLVGLLGRRAGGERRGPDGRRRSAPRTR